MKRGNEKGRLGRGDDWDRKKDWETMGLGDWAIAIPGV
jgi:hypothetical protein